MGIGIPGKSCAIFNTFIYGISMSSVLAQFASAIL